VAVPSNPLADAVWCEGFGALRSTHAKPHPQPPAVNPVSATQATTFFAIAVIMA
jgi:hypothetical protein